MCVVLILVQKCYNCGKGDLQTLGTRIERQIEWRRSKVAELDSQGHSQPEIARILHVSLGTINGDLAYLRQQAKQNIRKYIDEKLPQEYEKCLISLNLIQKEAWNIVRETEDKKEKLHALSLVKECCENKLDLLTNAAVVEDAITFVSSHGGSVPGTAYEAHAIKVEDDAPALDQDKVKKQRVEEIDIQRSKENNFNNQQSEGTTSKEDPYQLF